MTAWRTEREAMLNLIEQYGEVSSSNLPVIFFESLAMPLYDDTLQQAGITHLLCPIVLQ